MVSLPIAAVAGHFWFYGWFPALGMTMASVAALALWRVKAPESFSRWITRRVRSRFLSWFRYRRQWSPRLDYCSLSVRDDLGAAVKIPRLLGIDIGKATDTVRAAMLLGQWPDDWANRASHLPHAFGAQECRVSITGPARLELAFRRTDSLAKPISAPVRTQSPADWAGCPVRKAETPRETHQPRGRPDYGRPTA
ncbi:hypothetical protein C5E45_00155 [Nocardia nova]|uniref:Uncharacterized protein n=1 Tax=Nocardia nova TaxID=37330 RepID=A0A2S6AWP5_9NOCA|nr:hypothetical protein [Nocardia nova]PPJ28310.1 hypothetical protein C5E41_13370 [Nocardia nova]PPJ39630.1 hypothetical protein C5E45_00155 [Nocardia nova]